MKSKTVIAFLGAVLIFSSTAVGCPAGFIASNGSCYYLSGDSFLNWENAVVFCKSMNSTLTSVKTQNEYTYIQDLAVKRYPLYPVWIGLHRDPAVTSYPRWIWLDDNSLANKSFFNTNTIDANGCISWRTLSSNDGFETINCLFEQPFICKTSDT